MGKQTFSPAFEMAAVRKEILTYCGGLPQIIKTHGSSSLGTVSLNCGKCFLAIGTWLDNYALHAPIAGIPAMPRVSDLGEELRIIGVEFVYRANDGDLHRTIETLKHQVWLLNELAKRQAHDRRAR